MTLAASCVTALVALLHTYFLVLEMFLWTTPFGQKTFKRTRAQQEESAVLAKNQGLYNGFLVAGLVWSFVAPPEMRAPLRYFFLGCVIVAGVYGAATVDKKIFFVQALPALVALGLVVGAGGS